MKEVDFTVGILPIRKELWDLKPEDILPSFLLYKRAEGLADRTILDYKQRLGLFFLRFPDALEFPRERTLEFLSAYKNPSTYNIYYAYLKVFWDWIMNEGYFKGKGHPLGGIRKRKQRGRIVQLSEKDIARLLSQPDKSRYTGLRDYSLICLSIDTGIRPGEALQLMPDDFSPEKKEIIIRAEVSKTRVPRVLPLSVPTVQAIQKLLTVRPWKNAPIFANELGTQLAVCTWSKRVKDYGKKCGLKITAYHLRHASALLLLRRGADAFTVQNMLGHSTLQMTKHYLALTLEDTRKGHENAAVLLSILGQDSSRPTRMKKISI